MDNIPQVGDYVIVKDKPEVGKILEILDQVYVIRYLVKSTKPKPYHLIKKYSDILYFSKDDEYLENLLRKI